MKTVELCSKCNGFGYLNREEIEDYHRNTYDRWREHCDFCNGTGRRITEETVEYSGSNTYPRSINVVQEVTKRTVVKPFDDYPELRNHDGN